MNDRTVGDRGSSSIVTARLISWRINQSVHLFVFFPKPVIDNAML